jgi:hypothetical protein
MAWQQRATLFLVLLLILSACAGHRESLRLGQISERLGQFEGTDYDVLQASPVHYTRIGEAEYDLYFEEAAAVLGSALFARRVLDRAEEIVGGKRQATMNDLAVIFTVMTETLPRTQKRAIYLLEEGERLRAKAPTDFFWRFYKLPRARKAVLEAQYNLESARDMAPELITSLRRIYSHIQPLKLFDRSF